MPRNLKPRIVESVLTIRLLNQDIRYFIEVDLKEKESIVLRARSIECSPIPIFTLKTELNQVDDYVKILEELEFSIRPRILSILLRPIVMNTFSSILEFREEAVRNHLENKPPPREFNLFTISLSVGSLIQLTGLAAGFLILWFIYPTDLLFINYLLLLSSWIIFWYFSHCLAHYIVGRILGIAFSSYFVGLSNLYRLDKFRRFGCYMITLGIYVDRSTGKRTRSRMAVMYLSGAFSSMLLPLVTLVRTFEAGTLDQIMLISTITTANIIFTLLFSSRAGDINKALKTHKK
ncbi:MAG: hypothetical protein NZ929_01445 [Aigarchaeota archaeon]|nr:hypothetical protein [Aigarchaeota archaeon]MCX8193530.1 hypothetical protein [Nitrososphaeria archaeon]MDW7986670.1 hypothetical protein [Nitrososphaerota archaeon]